MCFKKKQKVERSLVERFIELFRDAQKPYSEIWDMDYTNNELPIFFNGSQWKFLAYKDEECIFGIPYNDQMKILIEIGECASEIAEMLKEPLFRGVGKVTMELDLSHLSFSTDLQL